MKIRLDKAIAEFIPENGRETAELESLWIKMGNCIGDSKSLEPIGVYVPQENNVARFFIKGLSEEEKNTTAVVIAPYDTDVYCATCNKTVHVKKGEPIPICCGKVMEPME